MRPEWQALQAAGQVEHSAYARAFAAPEQAQAQVLADILRDVAGAAHGQALGIRADMDVATFRSVVPIMDDAGLTPLVDRIIAGEPQVLTTSPVIAFELTGGTSGGRKPVPYTAALLAAFQRTIMAWFADFLTHVPDIGQGRAYFAISPALAPAAPLGGIPVGLGSDLAYFGPHAAHLGPVMLYDAALETADHDAWVSASLQLLNTPDLTLISVWSPTFLTALLDRMDQPPAWPALAMISAWADASSAQAADDLAARLPGAQLQPKGLLATEGVFTFPLFGAADPLPAIRSSFLEFRDAAGVHLVGDLVAGQTYDLIVTTQSGILRYANGDRVTCTGHAGRVPMLRFVGRSKSTDLVGEKLTEDFVIDCLRSCVVSGVLVAGPKGYTLVAAPGTDPRPLDAALSRNPQYAYARRMQQLGLPTVVARDNLMADVVQARLRMGHRLSDVKVPVLMTMEKALEIWPDLT